MSASTFRLRPLSDLFEIDKTQISKEDTEYSTLSFIGLENIESHSKRYLPELTSTPEGLCNRFSKKHVLYGKLRPYLNKVYLPDFDGKCSTEILPLLPKNSYTREFISIILQSQTFIEEAVKHSTGGRMPRANLKYLLKLKVSVPEAEEANIIASGLQSQLAHIETMRQVALKQKESAKALQSAILREIFPWKTGESLPDGWRWEKIANCIKNDIEPFKKSNYPNKEFTYIDISSIDSFAKSIFSPKIIEKENAPSRAKFILRENDIIISNVRPNLNAVALVDKEFQGSVGTSGFTVVRLKDGYDANFFFHFFTSPYFIDYVTELVQGAMYPAINDKDIKKCLIPVPNFENQRDFAELITEKINRVVSINQPLDMQLAAIEALPAAILREAFNFEINEN